MPARHTEATGVGAPFWSRDAAELLAALDSGPGGLPADRTGPGAAARPPVASTGHRGASDLRLLLGQVRSPITVLLLVTALLAGLVGERSEAVIILVILLGSLGLGFWQERGAVRAVEALASLIPPRVRVRRAGVEVTLPATALVPGDVMLLRAGDAVAADARILEARDLAVDEAALTGESVAAEKRVEAVAADVAAGSRASAVFAGSHVVRGSGEAVVVAVGPDTVFGALAARVRRPPPESEFERGVRRFGYFLVELTTTLVLVVFAANVALRRPVLDVFLFALALAVGLTPQLLPAIVAVTLSRGARRMADREVIVRRLVTIEDFGAMTILCTDKTGTLTEGRVAVGAAVAPDGTPSDRVLRLARINAALQSGFASPIDEALQAVEGPPLAVEKLGEVPYDFARRRLSVLVRDPSEPGELLITKGAVREVLAACTRVRDGEGADIPLAERRVQVEALVDQATNSGRRCLAVASARGPFERISVEIESGLVLEGLLLIDDPPKPDARASLERLHALGVRTKMVTGDHRGVAEHVARAVGLDPGRVCTGAEIRRMSEAQLRRRVRGASVFAEVDPNQKERIILALRREVGSVGYLGDGVNDAAALHAAAVGISVDTATDVTRQAAGIVLLRKDLGVLADGIEEGRRAFANTLKYVFITVSANFGNMFSMAGASLLVPFLPMLPQQILLLNLLSDLPAMAIATDRLDPEAIARPRRWDVHVIRRFMIRFGLLSSFFDLLTFGFLLLAAVPVVAFRTGWFLESLLTEVLLLLVVRTGRPFFRSAPSRALGAACAGVVLLAFVLPYVPGAGMLGFGPLSGPVLMGLLALSLAMVGGSELLKRGRAAGGAS